MSKVRKMLSNWESLAIWAVDYSELVILPLWSKYYPDDLRPKNVLNAAREWLSGAIKLPQAKTAILECHAAAREAGANLLRKPPPGRSVNAHRRSIQHGIVSGLPFMER